MKILVTGADGQLGQELPDELEAAMPGITTYVGHKEMDITDAGAVERYISEGGFTHVVNCAAYTAVDRAEEDKSTCTAVNVDGIRNIARLAEPLGLHIIHISTDYVYDGNSCRPYTEADKVSPLSHYGSTKRKGETSLLGLSPDAVIIRTSWLYSGKSGRNFPGAILRRAIQDGQLHVVADQVGTPTDAKDLAAVIAVILASPQWIPGIYNYSNEGVASWYDFAKAILRIGGLSDVKVMPIKSADYPVAAERPVYAVLDKSLIKATYGIEIPHWEESLRRTMSLYGNDAFKNI
jgi:dTDP-4-dehydrorhamnose reductase